MSEVVLTVTNLGKSYQSFKKDAGVGGAQKSFFNRQSITVNAVRDLSFSIRRGEFVGLLGPNGAGKTTTLKMLTGLIRPSVGNAVAFGKYETAHRSSDYLRKIGMVMGQRNQLNPDLPANDSFRLAQSIYDLPDARYRRRLDECLDLFAIREKLLIPVRKLSLGERMKMEMILALLHEPELVFLDEPTIGLDFNAARQIRGFLKSAARNLGITFILTSHYTKDIEELCKRVILINRGKLLFDGPLKDVDKRLYGQKKISLVVATSSLIKDHPDLEGLEHIVSEENPGLSEVSATVAGGEVGPLLQKLTRLIPAEKILDLKVQERGLDEIFSELFAVPEVAT